MFRIICCFIVTLAALTVDAQAYIGPGLGAGAVGAILGLLASIFVAIFAIFWYPIKRLLKLGRKKKQDPEPAQDSKPDDSEK